MLKNHLTKIKGELLSHIIKSSVSMSGGRAALDYENFYEEARLPILNLIAVKSVDQLEEFLSTFEMKEQGLGLMYFYEKHVEGSEVGRLELA